ncbi:MAG: Aspartate carbamoyltransferase [Methanomicrobiales archaeon 53_19]|jgi:aspartate carbamoyltransferase catalytic subunit|uniref:aspartate carbamoyltransferase n=1 Tax=Methanocalculus sp. TaxID=2004547 RepID=UPI0007466DDB|nr:aspartate carbamoyltransferase [Methanocalculus sp.]KUL05248.1 MAG: Aspartate carbamoyltransferase [Methanomicrobiales archaeon 53_19]HIJ05749.1 aspartate carbamoyltransferase [Methanocalculus sp.]
MRHIISINEVSTEEIDDILDRASAIEEGAYDPDLLNGKILANLFFEPSTRTQMSFVSAMFRLGGKVINLGSIEASSIAKGETLADTIRVVSGYADAIVLRHPKEGAARLASEFSDVPVINAGDGAGQHPSQTLLDLFTIRQSFPLNGINVGFLGDLRYGRTAHSLATALSRYGVIIHTITPPGLELPPSLTHDLLDTGTKIVVHEHLEDIIADLDVLYVTRIQRERFPDPGAYASVASGYRVTPEMLADVSDRFILMHPLPRVDEIDPQVDSMPCARYFEQARNGVPIRMAMLQKVLV